jgi:hypothetical protein
LHRGNYQPEVTRLPKKGHKTKGERCYSTLVCAKQDKDIFEKIGYRLEESKPLSADGKEIPGAVVMVDEQANYGHYSELTALTGIPLLAV